MMPNKGANGADLVRIHFFARQFAIYLEFDSRHSDQTLGCLLSITAKSERIWRFFITSLRKRYFERTNLPSAATSVQASPLTAASFTKQQPPGTATFTVWCAADFRRTYSSPYSRKQCFIPDCVSANPTPAALRNLLPSISRLRGHSCFSISG